jgi:outer membrane protein TolC
MRYLLLIGMLLPLLVNAQRPTEQLTIEQAIRQALARNYGIRLLRMDAQIAQTNNTPGNAGQLPQITTTWGGQLGFNNTKLDFFTGETRTATMARNTQVVGNVMANWTIYDGLRIESTKERLEELQKLGAARVRVMIDQTIAQVVSQYYQLVVWEKMRRNLDDAVTLSEARKNIAEEKEQIGTGAGIAVLQAKTDMNADSSALIAHENNIAIGKMELNRLMGRPFNYPFTVDTSINMFDPIDVEAFSSMLKTNNPQLLAGKIDIQIAEALLKEQKADFAPRLTLSSGLLLSQTTTQLGVLKSNLSYGPMVGVGLTWNLYNGNANRMQVASAELNVKRQKLSYEQLLFDFEHQLRQTHQAYLTQLSLVALEQKNVLNARENFDIALQQFFIGVINDLDLRQTQQKFLDTQARLYAAQLQAKLLETELLRLGSGLKTVYKAGN